jgi:hypothetical protein
MVTTRKCIYNYDSNYPEKYYRDIPISEDLILLRELTFEGYANHFIEAYNLNNYIQISGTIQIPYGNDWLDLDEVERRAFEIVVNKVNIERHKAAQAEKEELKKNLQSSTQNHSRSMFDGIPMSSISMR